MVFGRRQSFSTTSIWVLIGLNSLVFIALLALPSLVFLLGFIPGDLLTRPWTIVTSIFVHSSIGHILANMITLYFFGSYLCLLVGKRYFLAIYFIGGILGNVLYMFLGSPFSIVVGASGAVYALGGVLAVTRPKLRVIIFPIPAPIPLWAAVIGGFVLMSFFPNVAWQAHLGGLVFGLAVGYFLKRKMTIL